MFVLGRSRSQVCADYGVSSSTLSGWLQEATGAGGSGSGSHLRKADASSHDPSELLKRVRELELENEFLKSRCLLRANVNKIKGFELIRIFAEEGYGGCPPGKFPISMMCCLLGVSRIGYYQWLERRVADPKPDSPRGKRKALQEEVIRVFKHHNKRAGARTIYKELKESGRQVSLYGVRIIMKLLRLSVKYRKHRRV